MNNLIHLVAGVSSSGKSTYIKHMQQAGAWQGVPVIFGGDIENERFNSRTIIHYNLFRSFKNNAANMTADLFSDPSFLLLGRYLDRIKVHFIVSHPSVLAKRVLFRSSVENGQGHYPGLDIFELSCKLNWINFYSDWSELFARLGLDVEFINADSPSYEIFDSFDQVRSYIEREKVELYTQPEIQALSRLPIFEYQSVEFPGGIRTKGADSAPNLALLDADLTGKSVLDVGCAYGYYCFEAERRNASRVVGTELMRHRFIGANILKYASGSRASFLSQDIFNENFSDSFDIIIFLNVIHHLSQPMKALKVLAELCKEKLIFEFPALLDPKFLSTLPKNASFDSALPLIGVSTRAGSDQTFVFSEAAIRRILMDHEKLFSRVEFIPSPMHRNRSVAICYK